MNGYSYLGDITQKWMIALLPFSSNYSAKYSASQLSKLTKIPQQTISRELNKLVSLHILNYEESGRNKLFFLEKSNSLNIIVLLETLKTINFSHKFKEISLLIEELVGNDVIIFGSYASLTANKKSDLDIVILGKSDIKQIKRKHLIEINDHQISYTEFKKLIQSNNALALEIKQNHVFFGNVSKLVKLFI